MTTNTIGVYVRVSRKGDREDERFHSPKEQAERATALALARGFVPGPTFEDIDISGATAPADRPGMGALLERIDAGELAGVAAFSLDRLSREPAHGDALVKRVTKAGGVILTPDIPDAIDSPTGEFTFGMLLQVAKLYRSQSKARWLSAQERAILSGIPVGRAPVGYRRGADRRLELDPDVAPVVREVFERWAAGEGRTAMARLLDEATGRKWSCQAVDGIIRNRLYMTGRLEYGGVTSEHVVEPIVDEPLWHAAQRERARPRVISEDSPWLLSGLARCGSCGRALVARQTRGGTPRLYRYYVCASRKCDAHRRANADRLEPWARDYVFALLGAKVANEASGVDLAPLEDAVRTTETRLEQALTPEAQDALGARWAEVAKERRRAHEDALAALGEARAIDDTPPEVVDLRERWDDLSNGERREALRLYGIGAVIVHGSTPAEWELMFR